MMRERERDRQEVGHGIERQLHLSHQSIDLCPQYIFET